MEGVQLCCGELANHTCILAFQLQLQREEKKRIKKNESHRITRQIENSVIPQKGFDTVYSRLWLK